MNQFNILSTAKKDKKTYTLLGGDQKAIENIEGFKQAECNVDEYQVYVDELKKLSTARTIYDNAEKLKNNILNNASSMTTDQLISAPQKLYTEIIGDSNNVGFHISDGIDYYLNIAPENAGKLIGVPSKWDIINKFTLGYQEGITYVYSGYVNSGKSLVLLNEADHIANNLFYPSLYIDTEMIKTQVQPRLLSIRTGLRASEIKTGYFLKDPCKVELVKRETEAISNGNLFFVPLDNFNEDTLDRIVQYYIIKHNIKVLFFDYIKLPSVDRKDGLNETQKIGNFMNHLKNNITKKLDLITITACQSYDDGSIADSKRIERFSDFLANWQINDIGEPEFYIKKNREELKDKTIYMKFNGASNEILEMNNQHLDCLFMDNYNRLENSIQTQKQVKQQEGNYKERFQRGKNGCH